jgi:hypothetical protein
MVEWGLLHLSPVYYGCGVPRGHGEPVPVVPGFMGSDTYLVELFLWLGRIGYEPHFSGIDLNGDCPNATLDHLHAVIRRVHRESGQKVLLIGHSLGGMLVRAAALGRPEHVAGVISMGSPFHGEAEVHPIIPAMTSALQQLRHHRSMRNIQPSCLSGFCTCTFNQRMLAPDQYEMPHYAIYSKIDGVVQWENCTEEDSERNTEVEASHAGMAWHPEVYRALAFRLREALTTDPKRSACAAQALA